jgi:hypothetical protein
MMRGKREGVGSSERIEIRSCTGCQQNSSAKRWVQGLRTSLGNELRLDGGYIVEVCLGLFVVHLNGRYTIDIAVSKAHRAKLWTSSWWVE